MAANAGRTKADAQPAYHNDATLDHTPATAAARTGPVQSEAYWTDAT
jgi:hypothetical protein